MSTPNNTQNEAAGQLVGSDQTDPTMQPKPKPMSAAEKYTFVSAAANYITDGTPADMVRAALNAPDATTHGSLFIGAAVAQERKIGALEKSIAELSKELALMKAGQNGMGTEAMTDLTTRLGDLEVNRQTEIGKPQFSLEAAEKSIASLFLRGEAKQQATEKLVSDLMTLIENNNKPVINTLEVLGQEIGKSQEEIGKLQAAADNTAQLANVMKELKKEKSKGKETRKAVKALGLCIGQEPTDFFNQDSEEWLDSEESDSEDDDTPTIAQVMAAMDEIKTENLKTKAAVQALIISHGFAVSDFYAEDLEEDGSDGGSEDDDSEDNGDSGNDGGGDVE